MSQRGDPPDGDNIIPFPRSRNLGRTGTGAVGTPEERLLAAIDFGLEKFERDLDRADREAVEVESVFIRRFGFDAPRHQRARLMELKCKSDLTSPSASFESHLWEAANILRGPVDAARLQDLHLPAAVLQAHLRRLGRGVPGDRR
jgi:hypothetical protein